MYQEDEKLLSKYLSNSYPKASLVCSLSDRDKSEFVGKVANHLRLESTDITDSISYEYLNDLYLRTDGYIYVVDLDKLTVNKQNVILKFVEECPALSYVILLTKFKTKVLPTILTRCVEFELHKYSKADIKDYTDSLGINDQLLIDISYSFDDVDRFRDFDLKYLNNLCRNIGESIGKATLPNTMIIPKKYLYFKEREQGKFNLEVFVRMLQYSLGNLFMSNNSQVVYYLYREVVDFASNLENTSFSREMLVDNLLLNLWSISRGGYSES